MSNNDALLAEVRRTNQLLEQLLRSIGNLQARGGGAPAGAGASASGGGGGEIADDGDLDSQYGNPEVRKDPTRWSGPSYVGAKYSDCPPDYLETLAGLLEWQAGKSDEKNEMLNNGKPRSMYLRKDAARARGWARRNAGKMGGGGRPAAARPAPRPAPPMDEPPMMDEDVPF